MESAKNAPKGLHVNQYAAWLCENRLAMPANPSNITVIGQAIEAIAKSRFRDEKWKNPQFTAFVWLDRQCEFAQMSRVPTNHLFFLNAEYLDVKQPEKKLEPLVPCGRCNFGWKYEMKDGQSTGRVVSCECRLKWIEEAKKGA